ncbi:MAG: thioredoxin domain-containing protein [Patescibacteria group bacterium]
MSNYNDHSKDKYIVGGVALILIVIAIIAFMVTDNVSQPNATPTPSGISVDLGTTTVPSDTISASSTPNETAKVAVVALAKCLAAKKVTMYGAYWCSHCQNQKKAFGEAWPYVPYVECTQNTQLCLAKGIEGYPTWIFSTGQKLEGEQTLAKLAQASGCSYSQ